MISRYFFWSHPEWWIAGICGFAWMVMVWHGLRPGGHAHQGGMFTSELGYWMLMAAAMMLPLVIDRVRSTAERSLWKRRHRAMAVFVAGYFVPWLVLGIGVAGLRTATSWTHGYIAPALSFVVAVLWQRSRMHRRALATCHRIQPLAPVGWQADRDCLRFGGTVGAACVWSCWPLMLGCAFTGHSLVAMAGGMAIGGVERWSYLPPTRAPLVGTIALAGYYVVLAVVEQGFVGRA